MSAIVFDSTPLSFEEKLEELYNQFQRGECSLGYLAEQLGITTWETVHLLEERGWHTSNL
jgi:hypothetical protein